MVGRRIFLGGRLAELHFLNDAAVQRLPESLRIPPCPILSIFLRVRVPAEDESVL